MIQNTKMFSHFIIIWEKPNRRHDFVTWDQEFTTYTHTHTTQTNQYRMWERESRTKKYNGQFQIPYFSTEHREVIISKIVWLIIIMICNCMLIKIRQNICEMISLVVIIHYELGITTETITTTTTLIEMNTNLIIKV